MKRKQLIGLLECPYHNGWIEFEYAPGDRIADLSKSIEAKWGRSAKKDSLIRMFPTSWAFFCEQKDGAYLSLRLNDSIPDEAPAGGEETIEDRGMAAHAFKILNRDSDRYRGLLDVFFLRQYWEIDKEDFHGKPVQPLAHYSMKLAFKRHYEIPSDRRYDAKLLALVAIVGG